VIILAPPEPVFIFQNQTIYETYRSNERALNRENFADDFADLSNDIFDRGFGGGRPKAQIRAAGIGTFYRSSLHGKKC
jgi:hypothetical protein